MTFQPNPLVKTLAGLPLKPQPEVSSQGEQIEPSPSPATDSDTASCADFVYLSDLQTQPVQWLWQDRLASGTLAMISGVPGSGKTWVALAIAAALSRGQVPYTGEACQPANVLYASMEHGNP